MTGNAIPDPDRFAVTMPRPFVDGHEIQWVIQSAFARFGVDHDGGKAARDLQTMPLHLSIVGRPIHTAMLGMTKPAAARFPHSG